MTRDLPDWNCPTPEKEREFKEFIFAELDRRLGADMDAMALALQGGEAEAEFTKLVRAGWTPDPPPKRGRGRPKVHPVEREFHAPEEGARLVPIIRDIFNDFWGRRNRGRPKVAEIAAEYAGTTAARVTGRMKRANYRRPVKSKPTK